LGETNSHQYLVRTSGEYINYDEINGEILALQAEIAQLRQDLLNAQINQLKSQTLGDEQTNQALDVFQTELNNASEELTNASTSISNNATELASNSAANTTGGSSDSLLSSIFNSPNQ
jgi:chromosome segregation ATPase